MLPDDKRKRIEDEARRRGVDPAKAVAEAERMNPGKAPGETEPKADVGESDGPIADRLLIGFLPFIKVSELRSKWLKLTDRVPDDEMMCGEFAAKHGGGAAPGGSSTPEGDDA